MEDLKVAHYGAVSVEMVKNNRRYQLMVPLGAAWDEAEATCDDFKASLQEMKRVAKEQADKLAAEAKSGQEKPAEQQLEAVPA